MDRSRTDGRALKIVRAADHRHMPWKNGGGETTEIAVFPQAAGLDDFDWRVSMARVEASGPFSVFPGIDRTLAILEGEGIRLAVGGTDGADIRLESGPHSFAADIATEAVLLGGAIRDLNVMTRRNRWSHRVTNSSVKTTTDMALEATVTILLCTSGRVAITSGDGVGALGPLDAALFSAANPAVTIDPESSADLYVIELFAAGEMRRSE